MTVLSVEVLAACRRHERDGKALLPDPEKDQVVGIVWQCSDTFANAEEEQSAQSAGAILRPEAPEDAASATWRGSVVPVGASCVAAKTEREVFEAFAKLVEDVDPDAIVGWDVQSGSLGYLAARFDHSFKAPGKPSLLDRIGRASRAAALAHDRRNDADEDHTWDRDEAAGLWVRERRRYRCCHCYARRATTTATTAPTTTTTN